MKKHYSVIPMIKLRYWIFFFLVHVAFGQGYDNPLTVQGTDHTTLQSAASRAAGGTTILLENDVSLMFTNPATLQSLKGIQVSVGGVEDYLSSQQVQQYAPLKYYSNFSLLMEGLTGYISNPDTSFHGTNAGDTVQRPYDNIGPNWWRKTTRGRPLQVLLGVPFTLGDHTCTIGLGAVQYANLNSYYANNNILSPAIGSERPTPTPLPTGTDSLPVSWYQYIRDRDGYINGYGIAFSGSPVENLSVGLSALFLSGSSDDYEQHTGRGTLLFFANWFRLDSVYNRVTRTGTSDYSGQEFTLSGIYHGRNLSLGFSIKPPMTITRKFNSTIRTDTTGSPVVTTLSGEDKIKLPWRGMVGLSLLVRDNIRLGLEYEIRSYASAVYTDANGTESNPWLSASVAHFGVDYAALDWLSIRAGVHEQAEVFQEEGNPLIGDAVSFTIYSAGCGLQFSGVHLNLTYEYGLLKYDDTWQTNVNINRTWYNTLIANVLYDVPWKW